MLFFAWLPALLFKVVLWLPAFLARPHIDVPSVTRFLVWSLVPMLFFHSCNVLYLQWQVENALQAKSAATITHCRLADTAFRTLGGVNEECDKALYVAATSPLARAFANATQSVARAASDTYRRIEETGYAALLVMLLALCVALLLAQPVRRFVRETNNRSRQKLVKDYLYTKLGLGADTEYVEADDDHAPDAAATPPKRSRTKVF